MNCPAAPSPAGTPPAGPSQLSQPPAAGVDHGHPALEAAAASVPYPGMWRAGYQGLPCSLKGLCPSCTGLHSEQFV